MRKLIKVFFAVIVFGMLLGSKTYAAEIKNEYVKYKNYSIYTQCYNCDIKNNTAIIFIHGLGGESSNAEFLNDSQNPYMTIAYDNLNHGKSSMTNASEVNWNNEFGIINAIINKYHLKKVYLVGHSVGADIAMMYAKRYPQKVRKIVLIDRAYYNYSDEGKLNFTKNLLKILGYSDELGMSKAVFYKYIDMVYDNDITKTWDIRKNVLLIASNPNEIKDADYVDTIKAIKQNPKEYNITPEDATKLPNLSLQNVNDISDLFKTKAEEFNGLNHGRFKSIQTSFSHNMIDDSKNPEVKGIVRKYILDFFGGNK